MSTKPARREWILSTLQAASILALLPESLCAENWTPQFLSPDENSALTTIGEAIIPGSIDAHCNRVIDGILTIESKQNQADLKSALNSFKAFPAGTPERQTQLLASASQPADPLYPHFELIKEWVADTYWSSEKGLKELGWNGQVAWANYPGCEKHGI